MVLVKILALPLNDSTILGTLLTHFIPQCTHLNERGNDNDLMSHRELMQAKKCAVSYVHVLSRECVSTYRQE